MPDPKKEIFSQRDEGVPSQEERAAARRDVTPRKGIVKVRSLHVRKDHSATAAEVGGLTDGTEVSIMDTWTDGKDTWAKVGPDQWAAMIYNGETFIEYLK